MKAKVWLWLILFLVLLLVSLIGSRWWNRDVVPIKTATIRRASIEEIISASGTVNAPVYEMGNPLGGKIASLKVSEGERVKRGTLLLEFADGSRLVAPDSGLVAKVNYREGESVLPGTQPAVVVVNYDRSWVEAQIDEIDIADVKIGDRVKITSDVYPDKIFDGRIDWIAPLAELRKVGGRIKVDEESYVFPCKIKFLGDHSGLYANMSVNADLIARSKNNVPLVPREALVSQDDAQSVFMVKKNRVYQTKVSIGIRSSGSVEAVAGVSEGDVVAITNVAKLKDKGRVKIER